MTNRRCVRIGTQRSGDGGRAGWATGTALALAAVIAVFLPTGAAAHGQPEAPASHSLTVRFAFPDAGIADGEQLCLALHAGNDAELLTPLQSQCLPPGATSATFDGLAHGSYRLIVPALGTTLVPDRYAGQLVDTEVPDLPEVVDFSVDVVLALRPEVAGTTGSVAVEVFACSPGTNVGGDATTLNDECEFRVGGVPLTITGVGTVDETVVEEVTGEQGDLTGRVEFPALPAGAYQLAGEIPDDVVAGDPTLVVTSNVDGSTTVLEPGDTLAVRPAEDLTVGLFLVLEETPAIPSPAVIQTAGIPLGPPGPIPPLPPPPVAPTVAGGLDTGLSGDPFPA